jgi:hypothetical protein
MPPSALSLHSLARIARDEAFPRQDAPAADRWGAVKEGSMLARLQEAITEFGIWLTPNSMFVWILALVGWILVYRRCHSPLTRAAVVILPLMLLDGLWMGQVQISLVAFVSGMTAQSLLALVALTRHSARLAGRRVAAAGLYLTAAVAAFSWVAFNQATARERAFQVISACNAYRAAHGALPERLDQLVPNYLPRVPRAKFTGVAAEFVYRAHDNTISSEALTEVTRAVEAHDWARADALVDRFGADRFDDALSVRRARRQGLVYDGQGPLHSLQYTTLPPYGRRVYFFEPAQWVVFD